MRTEEENIQRVLVVDDTPENIDVLTGVLKKDYRILVAKSGEMALKIAGTDNPPDIILLDIMMPEMDGYEVCSRLKEDISTRKIPVIFVTARDEVIDEAKGFDLGAVDYITKPFSATIVQARVKSQLALYDQKRELERLVKERTSEIHKTKLEIIRRLGVASEYKDEETGDHVMRMSHYSRIIGEASGMCSEEADLVLHAAPMHDVGKIGIPDCIIRKPGKLNCDEWKMMKTHTVIGAKIIGEHKSDILKAAGTIALTHHEKWDGSGYPRGLERKQIPVYGRIAALADVFDALTSVRPYKDAWSVEDAVEEIKKCSGRHFDPYLVEVFLETLPDILKIKEKYNNGFHFNWTMNQ